MECLFNTYSDNVAGYCHNPQHPYGMTVAQITSKNCLGKQCAYLERNESHQWWHQREVMKQKRKNRKKKINDYVSKIKGQC